MSIETLITELTEAINNLNQTMLGAQVPAKDRRDIAYIAANTAAITPNDVDIAPPAPEPAPEPEPSPNLHGELQPASGTLSLVDAQVKLRDFMLDNPKKLDDPKEVVLAAIKGAGFEKLSEMSGEQRYTLISNLTGEV